MSVGPNGEDTVELPCSVGELKVSIRASPTASNGSFDSTSSYPSLLVLLVPFLRGPAKAPLLYFEFVEFFGGSGGSGRVSACLANRGFGVAPPLDLSSSRHYDMSDHRLLEWSLYMIEPGVLELFCQSHLSQVFLRLLTQ